MKRFEKIAKRYALANSYFKNRLLIWPDTLCEIHDYLQQHGELPFRYDGDNWSYDALCERQKRRGVRLSQYLTPDATARQIAALAVRYFENDSRIMDVCCGTGQLTRALIAAGVHPSQIVGLEVDRELADFYARLYPVTQTLIGPYRDIDFRCENVVANPPFETTEVVDFLSWLAKVQQPGDRSVLLLPHGFIDKQRPKGIQETLRQFKVTYAGAVRADKCHSRNSRSGATIASIAKHSGRPLAPGSAFQVGIGSGCGIAVSAIFRIFTEYWHCSMM